MADPTTIHNIRQLLSDKLDRIQVAMGWKAECDAIRDEICIPRSLAFRLVDTILDRDNYEAQRPIVMELANLIPQTPPSISGWRP